MKQAYTPALQVLSRTKVRKLRELPLQGTSLVKLGDRVDAKTAVLRAELPGDLTIVRVADRMGFDPSEILPGMKIKTGDSVERGQLLCERKTFFNYFTTSLASPAEGVVEFFTEANAHLGIRHQPIPLSVQAYISGEVVDIEEGKSVTIETEATFLQGIFGVGGERHGQIRVLPAGHEERVGSSHLETLEGDISGNILVGGAQYSLEALKAAADRQVSAVVTGSIDAEVLAGFVGYEIGVSITGDEQVPFTLIVTEGFGSLPISERVVELCKKVEGRLASVNGATQVRAGATRPEIIVPLEAEDANEERTAEVKTVEVGARIRVIRVPNFGQFATITNLPHAPQRVPSGALVRVLTAKLDSGEEITIPRANVELV